MCPSRSTKKTPRFRTLTKSSLGSCYRGTKVAALPMSRSLRPYTANVCPDERSTEIYTYRQRLIVSDTVVAYLLYKQATSTLVDDTIDRKKRPPTNKPSAPKGLDPKTPTQLVFLMYRRILSSKNWSGTPTPLPRLYGHSKS